jgi:peptide/nickel transport system permease protein
VLVLLGRRLLQAVPTVLLSSVMVFLLLRLLPGDPAVAIAGSNATPEVVEAIRADLGLDQPLPIQYLIWLNHIVQGDLGNSVVSKQPVASLIAQRAPATLQLAAVAIVLSTALAFVLGITAAVKQHTTVDWVISSSASLAIAVPNFWLGILLILVFAIGLGWLPPGGRAEASGDPGLMLRSLVLPAFTLSLPGAMALSRLVKTSMLQVLYDDYIRTARAKGLGPAAVIGRHALRNAMMPVITAMGIEIGRLLGGAVIVESVFGWAGLGTLMLNSIGSRDYAVVQSGLLLLVLVYIGINLLIDFSYELLDPRLAKRQGAAA